VRARHGRERNSDSISSLTAAPPVMGTSMMGAARPRGSPGGLGLVHRRFLASNRRRPAAVPGLADELARRRRGAARAGEARGGGGG
jgi:hypothetical protein